MKRNWRNSIIIILLSVVVFTSCNKGEEHAEHSDTYTCPMHPTVVSDKPGTCPVCGMDLVRKARPGEEIKITEDLSKVIKSPNEVVVASIKTIKGEYKSVAPTVQAQGVVTYDTRNIYTIPARFGGRLEKVYLKYVFQHVQKGQKVGEIYSPELITAQRELLYLVENDPENPALIESAKNKLLLLGASATQIENLIKRKEVLNTFTVYSPYSGYLINDDQSAPSKSTSGTAGSSAGGAMGGGMGNGMSSSSSATSAFPIASSSGSLIREGDYVSTGQTLFKVVNPSSLRIELDLPVSQAGPIKVGDEVELDFGNGGIQKSSVDFVQPFFSENEEFVKLRVYTKDMQNLQIGQLVKASIKVKPVESLWVPKKAVLDLGLDRIVFVKEREAFRPRKVTTGVRSDEWIEIKQGLASSDEIASNAHYLVDSESFIKVSN